jgi:hypothetical protein
MLREPSGAAPNTADEERSPEELAYVTARVRQAIAILAVDQRQRGAEREIDRELQRVREALGVTAAEVAWEGS